MSDTKEIQSDAVTIEWYEKCRLAVGMVRDRFNPNVGWLSDVMVGLRSDGVVVWKRIGKVPSATTKEPK